MQTKYISYLKKIFLKHFWTTFEHFLCIFYENLKFRFVCISYGKKWTTFESFLSNPLYIFHLKIENLDLYAFLKEKTWVYCSFLTHSVCVSVIYVSAQSGLVAINKQSDEKMNRFTSKTQPIYQYIEIAFLLTNKTFWTHCINIKNIFYRNNRKCVN